MRKRVEAPADEGELTETQRKILTAALEIFAEKGFSGASTAAIAARAGVAEKTLFAQFKSKDELLARTLRPSVFLLIEPRAFERVREVIATPGRSLKVVLGALMRDRVELASTHRNKLRLVLQELLRRPELFPDLARAFQERIAPYASVALGDLLARGELRTDVPPRTLLRTIMSVTIGYSVVRFIFNSEKDLDDEEEIARIVSLLVDGARPRVNPPR